MTFNPYSPPQTDTDAPAQEVETSAQLELMASGQRMIIWAILSYLGLIILFFALGVLASKPRLGSTVLAVIGVSIPVSIAANLILSVVGVLRLGSGLGIRMPFRILLGVLVFSPLLNVLVLAVLSGRATRALRKAGYHVGLFGARKAG